MMRKKGNIVHHPRETFRFPVYPYIQYIDIPVRAQLARVTL